MSKRLIALGATAACMALVLFVMWPTIHAWRVRYAVADALQGADSVRLEEFAFHTTLASVELPRSEWPRVLAAVPISPDFGVPGLVRMCFIPHQRVVISSREHGPFEFTVCFACDQAQVKHSRIFATPYLWRDSLRHLFSSYGIRLRTDREYNDEVLSTRMPHS